MIVTMPNLPSFFCTFVFLCTSFYSVHSIKCHHCFPPMEEEVCKRSDAVIDCHEYKPLGYDSCVQVKYNGNHTLSRTCYRSFMCEDARTWCKLYGPCTVTCCRENMCNASNVTQYDTKMFALISILMAILTLYNGL